MLSPVTATQLSLGVLVQDRGIYIGAPQHDYTISEYSSLKGNNSEGRGQ